MGSLVNVGEDGHAIHRLDLCKHAQPIVETGAAKRSARGSVRLVVRRFEDERHPHAPRRLSQLAGNGDRVLLALNDTRPGDEHERTAATDREIAQAERGHRVIIRRRIPNYARRLTAVGSACAVLCR